MKTSIVWFSDMLCNTFSAECKIGHDLVKTQSFYFVWYAFKKRKVLTEKYGFILKRKFQISYSGISKVPGDKRKPRSLLPDK